MDTKTFIEENVPQTGEIPPIIAQLNQRIYVLQEECQKLRNQLVAFKQEKQKEKQDSPHTPLQIKEKIKEKNHYHNSKMVSENDQKKGSQKARREPFVPPTLEEVQAYMDEIGEKRFTAVRFWNYYEAKGWVLGKVKMKFWKRVLDNWSSGRNDGSRRWGAAKAPARQNVVTFNAFKPMETKGAVSYVEYERMKREGRV